MPTILQLCVKVVGPQICERVFRDPPGDFTLALLNRKEFYVSTVGHDETEIREYIRNQEKDEERLNQHGFWR
jgi:putative transposase